VIEMLGSMLGSMPEMLQQAEIPFLAHNATSVRKIK